MQKNRKAQTVIFEQMILFAIGVSIFITCFAVFNMYQGYFVSLSMNDQLGQMKNWVSSHILRLIQNEDSNSSIILEIPRRIGGEEYEIQISADGINVTSLLTMTSKKSPLFNLDEKYGFSGTANSIKRRFIIYKKGNEIIIS